MGKVIKRITRPIKKIIPKEIKPFLPYAAAAFGAPYLAGSGLGSLATFATKNPALTKALIAGTTAGVTDDNANILRTAALAAAPDVVQGGLRTAGSALTPDKAGILKSLESAKIGSSRLPIGQEIGSMLTRAADSNLINLATNPTKREGLGGVMDVAKVVGAQASVDQAAKLAEINQDEIDKYNEQLRKQGVLDKTKRRSSIFNIYINAGYEPDYVNSMLDRYGYDKGGIVEALRALKEKMKAPETVAREMSDRLRRKPTDDDNNDDMVIPPKKPKKDEDEDEKPVPVVVEGDLAGGLMAAADGVQKAFGRSFGNVEPVPMLRFAQGGRIGLASGGNYESYKDFIESTGDDELMDLYIEFLGTGDFTKLGDALKRKGYAKGGEIEIDEEIDDLNIMDFMKDQGVPYGEQASYGFDEAMADSFDMFQDYRKRGLIPMEMEFDEFLEIMRDSKKSKEGIMQMAKSDMEEMYEQYVFEMEEQGLQPMSFSDFLRQARSGMADGGIMEKDMRGGGFIPEGSKEKADDVPARLSKNEFVMTADAVRAAGGGSVNKGAKRMYDMMYSLEGKI